MKRIECNHWFIKENELTISFMNFCVRIKIRMNDELIFYRLEVINDSRIQLVFNFYSLEEAISFAEDQIRYCRDTQEIKEKYQTQFQRDKKKIYKKIKK